MILRDLLGLLSYVKCLIFYYLLGFYLSIASMTFGSYVSSRVKCSICYDLFEFHFSSYVKCSILHYSLRFHFSFRVKYLVFCASFEFHFSSYLTIKWIIFFSNNFFIKLNLIIFNQQPSFKNITKLSKIIFNSDYQLQ